MQITDRAVIAIKYTMIKQNIEDHYFRIGIVGDSYRGRSYSLEFPKNPDLNDEISEINGLKIATNLNDKTFLSNLVVDYKEDEDGCGIIFKQEKI